MSYLVIYVRDNPLFDRLTFTIFIFKDINNEYVFLVYPNLLISESTISALSIKYDKEPQRAMRDSTTNVENENNFFIETNISSIPFFCPCPDRALL